MANNQAQLFSNLNREESYGFNLAQNARGRGNEGDNSPVYQMSRLTDIIDVLSNQAKQKIDDIAQRGENVSIADMFDMQMAMNHLSQVSEMSSSIVMSTNQSIMSIAKNIR